MPEEGLNLYPAAILKTFEENTPTATVQEPRRRNNFVFHSQAVCRAGNELHML